jgi:predicted phage-related endonuclease
MPDPTLKTISASQVPMMMGISQWATRWQLYQHFRGNLMPQPSGDLIEWGHRLQDDILEWVADELHLDAIGNHNYYRHPEPNLIPVGATADGYVIDPELGLGWVECKNVDSFAFKQKWTDSQVPIDIELQHQTQLMVPHPNHGFATWGIIAALVGGHEPRLYRRKPNLEMQEKIAAGARQFLDDAAAGVEPAMGGIPAELEQLLHLYPTADEQKILTLDEGDPLIDAILKFAEFRDQASSADKMREHYKQQILARAADFGSIIAPSVQLKITKSPVGASTIQKKAYIMTRLTIKIDQFLGIVPRATDPQQPEVEV